MYAKITALALLAAAALPLSAQEPADPGLKVVVSAPQAEYVTARQLAIETGLDEREVRMVLGPRSGYALYRINFDRKQREFRDALGAERYQDLLAGRPIPLYRQHGGSPESGRLVAARNGRSMP